MHKLYYYKLKYGNLPTQGTTDWHKGRKLAFGGADMGSLFGQNKYENKDTMFDRKKTPDLVPCDNTCWGHWFEPVTKIFVRQKFGEVHEFGSIPHSYYPVCYSPDGIIVDGDDLVLLEIKNPIRRGINGKIPETYILQVKTGMCVMSVKHTLFVQCRFRRCTLQTSATTAYYDRNYHKEYRKRCDDTLPMHTGFLHWKAPVPLFDLAKVSDMTKALGKYSTQLPHVIIDDPKYVPTTGFVMKWKLFELNYTIIEPEHDFLKKNEKFLWSQLEQLLYKQDMTNMGWRLYHTPEIYVSYPLFRDHTYL